jgi:hypothetical protein
MNLADEGSSNGEDDESDNGNYDVPDAKKPQYVAAGKKQTADNIMDSDVAMMTANRQTKSDMSGNSG